MVAGELRQFEARDLGQVGEQGLEAPGALALRFAEEALALDVLLVVGLLHAGDCLLVRAAGIDGPFRAIEPQALVPSPPKYIW